MTEKQFKEKAKELVGQMTLEEKAAICSGRDFWHTKGVERLGIQPFMLTDGPHGLRKQAGDSDHLGINASVPATCFPTAAATACSFDRDLLRQMGEAMGEECRAEEVGVILGPAANIKRSPLCGRNFEYFSEDPLVAGEASAALIQGIQSKNVGACMKHYLANNQEKARLVSDSVIDERALREIYLRAFEIAVNKAQPWTLMCSYNKINGTYASDNKRLMTDVPRGEWGFEGAIMTDWGAMNDRVEGIRAGLDLQMPGPCDADDQKIVKAVQAGELAEEQLDVCAARVVELALRCAENAKTEYSAAGHDELARRIACESAVLLKRGEQLPLKPGASLAVVGGFAKKPRYQGAGSSKINPHKITSLCEALDRRGAAYSYAEGITAEGETDEASIQQAVQTVAAADVAVVMLGLPDSYESEGFDRAHMDLPEGQNRLMEALAATGTPLVVVLSTGGAVCLPWRDQADSILLMYLAGQNSGSVVADLLFGEVNPSGKLAETWPLRLEDTPCHGFFGKGGNVEYRESIYVGYRYYDKAQKQVAYPFGHGLSYTDFAYSDLTVSAEHLAQGAGLDGTVTVTNTGSRAGKEVVQIYLAGPQGSVHRPLRELRGFAKVELAPGESKQVAFHLEPRAFAHYDGTAGQWRVEGGSWRIQAASSSRDIRLEKEVAVDGETIPGGLRASAPAYYDLTKEWPVPQEQFEAVLGHPVPPQPAVRPFTRNSTLGQISQCPAGQAFLQTVQGMMGQMGGAEGENSDIMAMLAAMMEDMPLRQLAMLSGGAMNDAAIDQLLAALNAES